MVEEMAYAASRSSDHRMPQMPIEELEYSDEEKTGTRTTTRAASLVKDGNPFFQRERNVPALNRAEVSCQQIHV